MRLLPLLIAVLLAGCAKPDPIAAPPPPPQVVGEYDKLWAAAERAARDLNFDIARTDYRRGELTTEPMVSAQPIEMLWRHELRTADAVATSALATYRRTARFQIVPDGDGFVIEPTVQVQRQSVAERRITDPIFYRDFFRRGDERGTPESDRGRQLPYSYWYDVGRDHALERLLADMIQRRLG